MNENKINTTLNEVYKTTSLGDANSSIGSVFYGINHRQTPSPVPINRDVYGLTFFTRPQLNLTSSNVRAERSFIPLLTSEAASIQRIIRCYLDPRLNISDFAYSCPFVDHENAFMPLLTNHLLSCTGWPDPVLDYYSSEPGAYKETFSMVDSSLDIYSAYDITATFRNMVGDPIRSLFHTWISYAASVFKGIMVPYPDFMVKNEIDYNTRIYRLVLDKNKRYVQKIGCTGAAFPYDVPMGSAFDYDSETPLNANNDRIAIRFRCMGACYQDDIIMHEFNAAVGIFNPNMRESMYASNMQKIPVEALSVFNNRGYPRINPNTYELEWYVSREVFQISMIAFQAHMGALSS